MDLLVLYFLLAVVVSFVCSVLESVLLSVNMPYISVLEKENPSAAEILKNHKSNISKSIASILILNTVANTVGAAAVGAKAQEVFGSGMLFWASALLTISILFVGEIIPKTIGATYWKELAPLAGYLIRILVLITYPVILLTLFITNRINKGENTFSLTRDELLESALQSEDEGVLDEQESDMIENVLKLDTIKIKEILTPRTVVFALDGNKSVKDIINNEPLIFKFSRVPIFDNNLENITGIVLAKKIFEQALIDDNVKLSSIQKDIYKINENIPVSLALDLFIKKKDHMFLVLDSYDQTEGIVTLEDCVETILGMEIMDESDTHEDMREVAKQKMKLNRKIHDKKS